MKSEYDYGRAFGQLRQKLGATQGNLARQLGTTQGQLSKIEIGKAKPPADLLLAAEDAAMPIGFCAEFWRIIKGGEA